MRSGSLVPMLVRWGVQASRAIASTLLHCETILEGGRLPASRPRRNADEVPPEQLLSSLGSEWRDGPSGLRVVSQQDHAFAADIEEQELRLARLVLRSWSATVSTRRLTRPDILALTCEFLANPLLTHTYSVTRFSTVLALRSLYGVSYDNESLVSLRGAYDLLRGRFAATPRPRQQKDSTPHDNLLLDLLCLEGWVNRRLSEQNLRIYYEAFQNFSFGIRPDRRRGFSGEEPWPRLTGNLPDFGILLNVAFGQPTAIPGLDEVTGGLLPAITNPNQTSTGGLITLVAGPPGSGKTSLCLTISSRMAELGSRVRYIAMEENRGSLEAKLTSITEPLAVSLSSFYPRELVHDRGDFAIKEGSDFETLESVSDVLAAELADTRPTHASQDSHVDPHHAREAELFLVFPRVVVIDSLNALLQAPTEPQSSSSADGSPGIVSTASARRVLGATLNKLRELGVCVFLVGSQDACEDDILSYLVDNVFTLSVEAEASRRHPIRILAVEKTRLQSSSRGRHVFHLSGRDGCSVSPSLHAALKRLKRHPIIGADPTHRAVLLAADSPSQLELHLGRDDSALDSDELDRLLTIHGNAQVLVYGRGTSGKARFALSLAFEPRVSIEQRQEYRQYVWNYGHPSRELTQEEKAYLGRSRVLVVSFLYGKSYYEKTVSHLLQRRFRVPGSDVSRRLARHLSILDFYPGFIDPESVVAAIQREIRSGELFGRPYTAVILDGVHNLLMQFPLLEREPLLWPTLYRLFRTKGIETVTTFTFFRLAQINRSASKGFRQQVEPFESQSWPESGMAGSVSQSSRTLSGSENLFFHLLVSSCDYTFLMESVPDGAANTNKNGIRIQLASSHEGPLNSAPEGWWDPREFRFRPT